ncbi:glycosyltransferase family 39 protein [soil metagenome]
MFAVLIANALTDGYFRDEFYYLACARRLAWGYVDHPPFSVALIALITSIFGDSLLVLRATAAAAGAASVWLTGRIARRLGGNHTAETVGMVSVAVAPMLLGTATFYSMNVLEILIWTWTSFLLLDALDHPTTDRWVRLGVLLGVGLLNKISVLWLGAGIAVGLLLWRRAALRTRGPWLAATIAGLFLLPHVAWQMVNGWPTVEFIRNASADKMLENSVARFLGEQVMNMHPMTAPVWIAGLGFLLFARNAQPYRALACIYLVPLAILLLNRTSRSGYLAPAYPLLCAAGGVALQPWLSTRPRRVIAVGLIAVAGLATLPLAVPLLPTDRYVSYAASLGIAPSTEEKKDLGRLPQFFADREGWPQLVSAVGRAWHQLPEDERAHAAVLVGNYGEAGAIEQLTRAHAIPVISGHNNYWLWGPGDRRIDTLIVLSSSRERQAQRFASVEEVGRIDCGDCMPYEHGLTIFIGRGLKTPLAQLWADLRHFD